MTPPRRLPSLAHRDFRNFQLGSFISNVGTMIQSAAISWHVYDLTQDSLYVGLVALVRVLPLLAFSLFGGVIADHYDRRSVLLVTQSGMAVVAVLLAGLTALGHSTVAVIYVLVALSAVARAFNGPARQAMMASLVPAREFANAASVNGIAWRLSDVLGPIIAGFLIASQGIGTVSGLSLCYLFNAASFVAVLWAIWILPKRPPQNHVGPETMLDVVNLIRDGIRFVRRVPVLKSAMWIDFWATFLSSADALFPAFAADILNLDSRGYGFLAASTGIGSFLAAGYLAWMPAIRREGRWVVKMIFFYGIFTVLFGLSQSLWTAMLLLAATGAADMVSTVMRQTIRQLSTPDEMRGRMASIAMLFQISGPQLGDFEAGALAKAVGERASVVSGGIGCVLVALWYWMRGRSLRDFELEKLDTRAV